MVTFATGFALVASLFSIADGKGHTVPFKVRETNETGGIDKPAKTDANKQST